MSAEEAKLEEVKAEALPSKPVKLEYDVLKNVKDFASVRPSGK